MKKEDVEKNKKSFNFSLKLLAYLTFFYFGVKLAFTLFLSLNSEFREVYGMINLIFSPILILLGIYFGYQLLKKKKSALIWLIVLVSYQLVIRIINMVILNQFKFPLTEIAYIILSIYILKNWNKFIEKNQNKLKNECKKPF